MDDTVVDHGSCRLTDTDNATCITMETSICGTFKDVDFYINSGNTAQHFIMNISIVTNTWPCSDDYALVMWRSIGSK